MQRPHKEAFQETSWVSEPEEGGSPKSTCRNSQSFDRAQKKKIYTDLQEVIWPGKIYLLFDTVFHK